MKITREVILDLLPVYLAGEASPATRELIDEYLSQDAELAERVRASGADAVPKLLTPLAPELELRSLARTRGQLWWLRWLFALATTFTALSLTSEIDFSQGRLVRFRFLIADYPLQFGSCVALAIAFWTGYLVLRRRLRSTL